MTSRAPLVSIIKNSFTENYKPGLGLQALALAIVLMYYFYEPFGLLLKSLGQLKNEGGFLFSGFSTALFGGVFPFLVVFSLERKKGTRMLPLLLFYVAFWFWKGMEVDLLYRFQAYLYGDSHHWWVIAKKVMTDQFVYCPLWAVPTMMLFYLWKDCGFHFGRMKEKFREDSFFSRILRILASNLVVWLPAVSIIYALPLDLQLPLFNIVLAFWTLILNSVSQK